MILLILIYIVFLASVYSQADITRRFTYGFDSLTIPVGRKMSALPYNFPNEATFTIVPEDSNVVLNKYVGRLEFYSNQVIVSPRTYTISFQKPGMVSENTVITVSFANGVSGDIVSYLQLGYFESYQFVKDVPLVLPNFLIGVPTSCSVTPPLPAGLSYNSNGLTGSPSAISDTETQYTFQCENQISKTNKVIFKTKVHSDLKPGILVSYFKYIGPDGLSCSNYAPMNAFHTKDVRIAIQKEDTVVGHPYMDNHNTPWDLSSDLYNEWGASWIGFIKTDFDDTYTFGTETDDGNWIFIDGKMIMDVNGCRPYKPRVNSAPVYLTRGYHYIVINYFQKGGPNALILYWSRLGSPTFVEITASSFYYAPKFPITYQYTYGSFNKGYNVGSIRPIVFGVSNPTSYQIPNLGIFGLTVNSATGEITGTITGDTKNVVNVLTVSTSGGYTYTFSLYYSAKDHTKAYYSYISWAHGVYYLLPNKEVIAFKDNYWDFRHKYHGPVFRTVVNGQWGVQSYTIPGTKQQMTIDAVNCGQGVLGWWRYIDYLWNRTAIKMQVYNDSTQLHYHEEEMYWQSIEQCGEGYHRLEVYGFGYSQQSLVGFVFQVEDVGGRVVFGASVKADGFDSKLGNCVVPGTYQVTGRYDNDNINDRPRLQIFVEKIYFTTIYGSAKQFSGTFIVGSVKCNGEGEFPDTNIGNTAIVPCGSNMVGIKSRQCGFVNNIPGWYNILDTCRQYVNPSNLYYGVNKVSVGVGREFILYPKYDGDINLFTISPNNNDIKINNVTGVITITGSTPSSNTYTITGGNVPFIANSNIEIIILNVISFNNVVGLKFGYNNHFILATDVPIFVPFYFTSGEPTLCSSNPSLPIGLRIGTNGIMGVIEGGYSTYYNTYVISCENSVSLTRATITTDIKNTFVRGAIASYGKLTAGYIGCDNQDPFKLPNSVVNTVRIENRINHPYNSSFVPWVGLSTDYREQFNIKYVFYLKIDTPGAYTIALYANKGAYLFIDGGLKINHGGCHDYSRSSTEEQLGVGYYLIEIYFYNTYGGYGIQLFWIIPGANDEVLIPSAQYYHIPDYEFTYKYQRTSYVINEVIDDNLPILYIPYNATNYRIEPLLPSGLAFSTTTGAISGKPIVHTDKIAVNYYVYANTPIGEYKAKISLDISDYQPPFDLQLRFTGSKKPLTTNYLLMFIGKAISLTVSASGNVNRYTSTDFPEGFNFVENTGLFYGTCTKPFKLNIGFGAISAGGLADIVFVLECNNTCSNPSYEPIGVEIANNYALSFNYELDIRDSDNAVQLFISKPNADVSAFYSTCFPGKKTLRISGSNMNLYGLDIRFYLLNQVFRNYTSLVGGGEYSTPFTTDIELSFVAPTISINPKTFTYFTGAYITIQPQFTGVFTRVEITPALPNGVILNQETLLLSGSALFRLQSTSYTLSIGTTSGMVSDTFTLTITDCESTNAYTAFIFTSIPMDFNILNYGVVFTTPKGSNVVSLKLGDDQNRFCVNEGPYHLDLSGPVWDTNFKLSLIIGDVDFGFYTKTTASGVQRYTVTRLPYVIDPLSQWKYANNKPASDWYSTNYTDSAMQSALLSAMTGYTTSAKYLRYRASRITDNNMIGVFLKFRHFAGCIVYVNGVEIYKKNIGYGSLNDNSPASDTFGILTEVQLFVPRVMFGNTNPVVALEFHRHPSDPMTFEISFTGYYVSSNTYSCYDLTKRAKLVQYSGYNDPENPVSNALDLDPTTTWIEKTSSSTGVKPFIDITFGDNNYYWFDTFGILSSIDAMNNKQKNPTRIQLDATDINGPQPPITSDTFVVADSQEITKKLFDTFKFYTRVKISVISRLNEASDTSMADILIRGCKKEYCSGVDKYPATLVDSVANVSCAVGFVGYELRSCRQGNNNPSWGQPDVTNCYPGPPSQLAYPFSQYTFTKGIEITEIVKPSYFSIDSPSFEIVPDVPAGLKFDTSNGQITGTATRKSNVLLYTVTAKNSMGSTNTQIYLTVFTLECKTEAFWIDTEKGDTRSIDCTGGYGGKRTRVCQNVEPVVWGPPNESSCVQIRVPMRPGKGEVHMSGKLTISNLGIYTVDSIFLDYIRIELSKLVTTDEDSILLTKGEASDVATTQIYNMYIAVPDDKIDQSEEELLKAFDAPFPLTIAMNSIYRNIFLSYDKDIIYNYVPEKGNNTLVIALSVTFGVIVLVIVGACVWIRCKYSRSKTRQGSVKLASSGNKGRATPAGGRSSGSGGSARSLRQGAGEKKSARSVRI